MRGKPTKRRVLTLIQELQIPTKIAEKLTFSVFFGNMYQPFAG